MAVGVYVGVGVGVGEIVVTQYVDLFLAQQLPCSILESPEQDVVSVI